MKETKDEKILRLEAELDVMTRMATSFIKYDKEAREQLRRVKTELNKANDRLIDTEQELEAQSRIASEFIGHARDEREAKEKALEEVTELKAMINAKFLTD